LITFYFVGFLLYFFEKRDQESGVRSQESGEKGFHGNVRELGAHGAYLENSDHGLEAGVRP
jgi:hypothetical protein